MQETVPRTGRPFARTVSENLIPRSLSEERECYFRVPDSMELLEAVSTPCYLMDFTNDKCIGYWANKAGLHIWSKKSNHEFQNNDFCSQRSEGVKLIHRLPYGHAGRQWHQAVQVEGSTVGPCRRTFHPAGGATTVDISVMPLRVLLPGEWEPRMLALCSSSYVNLDTTSATVNLAHEMLQKVDILAMLFAEDGELIHSNPHASIHYKERAQHARQAMSLRSVLNTFYWAGAEEMEATIEDIAALEIGKACIHVEKQAAWPNKDACSAEEEWFLIKFLKVRDPNCGKLAILVTCTNISEQKRTWHNLRFSRHREDMLRQAQVELKEFVSTISHELRTPLNGIIGLSDAMLANGELSERLRVNIDAIKTSGVRLAHLVKNVVDAHSVGQGSLFLRTEALDLEQVVQRAWCGLRVSGDVEFVNRVGESELPEIIGDRERIQQVLSNLVDNALKFTARGSIVVTAHSVVARSTQHVLVKVADSGCGIPARMQREIWLPFKQVDMTSTRRHGGAGLGLSLVKEIVEAHGGEVGVESSSAGATFWFTLPLKPPTLHECAASSLRSGAPPQPQPSAAPRTDIPSWIAAAESFGRSKSAVEGRGGARTGRSQQRCSLPDISAEGMEASAKGWEGRGALGTVHVEGTLSQGANTPVVDWSGSVEGTEGGEGAEGGEDGGGEAEVVVVQGCVLEGAEAKRKSGEEGRRRGGEGWGERAALLQQVEVLRAAVAGLSRESEELKKERQQWRRELQAALQLARDKESEMRRLRQCLLDATQGRLASCSVTGSSHDSHVGLLQRRVSGGGPGGQLEKIQRLGCRRRWSHRDLRLRSDREEARSHSKPAAPVLSDGSDTPVPSDGSDNWQPVLSDSSDKPVLSDGSDADKRAACDGSADLQEERGDGEGAGGEEELHMAAFLSQYVVQGFKRDPSPSGAANRRDPSPSGAANRRDPSPSEAANRRDPSPSQAANRRIAPTRSASDSSGRSGRGRARSAIDGYGLATLRTGSAPVTAAAEAESCVETESGARYHRLELSEQQSVIPLLLHNRSLTSFPGDVGPMPQHGAVAQVLRALAGH